MTYVATITKHSLNPNIEEFKFERAEEAPLEEPLLEQSLNESLLESISSLFFAIIQYLQDFIDSLVISFLLPNIGVADNFIYPENNQFKVDLLTTEGTRLNGCFVERENAKKVIIFSFGNAAHYESYFNMIQSHPNFKDVSLFMINHRNISNDGMGSKEEGIEKDTYYAYRYLMEKGYSPSNTLYIGQSFGGYYGLQGACRIQEEYPNEKVNFFSSRSYSRLSDTVFHLIPFYLGALVYPIIRLSKFDCDNLANLDTLKGKKIIGFDPRDGLVHFEASVAKAALDKYASNPDDSGITIIDENEDSTISTIEDTEYFDRASRDIYYHNNADWLTSDSMRRQIHEFIND